MSINSCAECGSRWSSDLETWHPEFFKKWHAQQHESNVFTVCQTCSEPFSFGSWSSVPECVKCCKHVFVKRRGWRKGSDCAKCRVHLPYGLIWHSKEGN